MNLELNYVNKLLGVNFRGEEVKALLERMRFSARVNGDKIKVLIPAYRTDILHPIDLVEDIAIAYGYENFKPELPKIGTIGKKDRLEKFSSRVRELMLGLEFQEVMTLIMTNRRNLFKRMNLLEENVTETENPISLEHSVARTWLLPSLMSVLEKNTNKEYPQRIFEIGDCIDSEGMDSKKLSGVIAHSKTNFSEVKAVVTGLLENLWPHYKIKGHTHKSFIEGRCGSLKFGFFGEIHPRVLENFNLEVPVTAFELDLNLIWNPRKNTN